MLWNIQADGADGITPLPRLYFNRDVSVPDGFPYKLLGNSLRLRDSPAAIVLFGTTEQRVTSPKSTHKGEEIWGKLGITHWIPTALWKSHNAQPPFCSFARATQGQHQHIHTDHFLRLFLLTTNTRSELKDPANQSRKLFPVTRKTPKPTDSEALDWGNSQLGWDIPAAVSSKKQNMNSHSPLRA